MLAKYSEEKLTRPNVCTVGYDGDKLVGFYGAMPFPAIYNGKEIWIAQGCDSITAPEYQGKGVHKQLARASYEIMKEDGIAMLFAMNSVQTARATKKLDMIDLGCMARFHLKTKGLGLNRVIEKLNWAGADYQKLVNRVLAPYELERSQFENPLNRSGLSVNYNAAFMEYKSYAPNHVIAVEGCQVWLKAVGVLSVGAVNGLTEENLPRFLFSIKDIGSKLMVKEVMFHISRDTPEAELLSKYLEPQDSWSVTCIAFDDKVDPTELRLNYSDFDTF